MLEDNTSAPVRYSCLSIFPDNIADVFAASFLLLYYSFPSLILSSIVMISFDIFPRRLRMERKGLSEARIVSLTKKEYGFLVNLL